MEASCSNTPYVCFIVYVDIKPFLPPGTPRGPGLYASALHAGWLRRQASGVAIQKPTVTKEAAISSASHRTSRPDVASSPPRSTQNSGKFILTRTSSLTSFVAHELGSVMSRSGADDPAAPKKGCKIQNHSRRSPSSSDAPRLRWSTDGIYSTIAWLFAQQDPSFAFAIRSPSSPSSFEPTLASLHPKVHERNADTPRPAPCGLGIVLGTSGQAVPHVCLEGICEIDGPVVNMIVGVAMTGKCGRGSRDGPVGLFGQQTVGERHVGCAGPAERRVSFKLFFVLLRELTFRVP